MGATRKSLLPRIGARPCRLLAAALAVGAVGLVHSLLVLAAPKTQFAVYRSTTADWLVRGDDRSTAQIQFGMTGDLPVSGDYEGRGQANLAVFRPSSQQWLIRTAAGTTTIQFGAAGDLPVPGDYLGTGRTQIAVFRPSTGEWRVRKEDGTESVVQFGTSTDQPVPADYFGTGHLQPAVFRPKTGEWFLRKDDGTVVTVVLGVDGDKPVPADYLGLNHAQLAIYSPTAGEWTIRADDDSRATVRFGAKTDVPVPADYDGIGRARLAVFRPDTAEFVLRAADGTETTIQLGMAGDTAVPAAYGIGSSTTPPGTGTTLTLDKDIQPIFSARCTGCHSGAFATEGMDLSAGNAYKNIVNVNSSQLSTILRVKPSDPDNSLLYQKVSTDTPSVGERMPYGGPALGQGDIDKIRDWIKQGAKP
jgi:hypothetical protein